MTWLLSLLAKFFKWDNAPIPSNPMEIESITVSNSPATTPVEAPKQPPATTLNWSTQKGSYHAVRVLCDQSGLSLAEKNTICACIYQESQFLNSAKHENTNSSGIVLSTDFGICQINDYWHIGSGKDFPSVAFLLANPDEAVGFMISMYQHGKLGLWVSYSSGAYKHWLNADSPMWTLGG